MRVNLEGLIFGELTVIGPGGIKRMLTGNRTERLWRCRCSCNREVDVRSSTLRRGQKTVCGWYLHYSKTAYGLGLPRPAGRKGPGRPRSPERERALKLLMAGWSRQAVVASGIQDWFVAGALKDLKAGRKPAEE